MTMIKSTGLAVPRCQFLANLPLQFQIQKILIECHLKLFSVQWSCAMVFEYTSSKTSKVFLRGHPSTSPVSHFQQVSSKSEVSVGLKKLKLQQNVVDIGNCISVVRGLGVCPLFRWESTPSGFCHQRCVFHQNGFKIKATTVCTFLLTVKKFLYREKPWRTKKGNAVENSRISCSCLVHRHCSRVNE